MNPQLLTGIPLSDGWAEGRLWHAHSALPQQLKRSHTILGSQVASEIGRMRQAVQLVSFAMENSICQVTGRLGKSYAGMFAALRELLHDPALLSAIELQIEKQHTDADSSIGTTFESLRRRLLDSPTLYLRERAVDLLELERNLLDALVGVDATNAGAGAESPAARVHTNAIAVTEILTPRLIIELNNTNVRGIVCEQAGPTSHAAILCRAFRMPAVAGIPYTHANLTEGSYAIVDGAHGTVECARRGQALPTRRRSVQSQGMADGGAVDLSQVVIKANLNLSRNAMSALSAGAQGIGLYRTEFEFMTDNRLLTKQEQFIRYRSVVVAMMGRPVTIRLMDIEVDKTPRFFESHEHRVDDDSSCGASLLLSWRELLEVQAQAITDAAVYGPVWVLYPMVADAVQFAHLKDAFGKAAGHDRSERMPHGAMIELPSAVDDAQAIMEKADFACLGTNDLIKHILHVDRETAIAYGAEIVHAPLLWEAIGRVAKVATALGKELTVCGEMASNLHVHARFIDLGIKTFSMDIAAIRHVKKSSSSEAAKAP